MARITVVVSEVPVGNSTVPLKNLLLNDLDKRQQLRSQTINPQGQEQYISPVSSVELAAKLKELGSETPAADAATLIANTVAEDDISIATIKTVANGLDDIAGTTDAQAEEILAILSYHFVETGNFLLSFHNGVIRGALDKGWIKVFTDAGDEIFSL